MRSLKNHLCSRCYISVYNGQLISLTQHPSIQYLRRFRIQNFRNICFADKTAVSHDLRCSLPQLWCKCRCSSWDSVCLGTLKPQLPISATRGQWNKAVNTTLAYHLLTWCSEPVSSWAGSLQLVYKACSLKTRAVKICVIILCKFTTREPFHILISYIIIKIK